MLEAGNAHRLPEKEIVKMFVSDLKPEVFREEIYSRVFDTLVDLMADTEILSRSLKESCARNPRKTKNIGVDMAKFPGNKGAIARLRLGRLS